LYFKHPALQFLISQVEVKNSKFISHLFTCSNFSKELIKNKIQELQSIHPKARHFVYASRYFNKSHQIVECFSDDGEPKYSSAIPTINVLRGLELINVCVISVRYFGGTKLGVGGLVRAYGDSCKKVINNANEQGLFQEYIKKEIFTINIDYSYMSILEHQVQKYDLEILNKDFKSDIKITLFGTSENMAKLTKDNNRISYKGII